MPISGNKQELVDRLQAAVGSELLDAHDELEEEEQLSEEAIKKAEAELQAQGDTSFSEVAGESPVKEQNGGAEVRFGQTY